MVARPAVAAVAAMVAHQVDRKAATEAHRADHRVAMAELHRRAAPVATAALLRRKADRRPATAVVR